MDTATPIVTVGRRKCAIARVRTMAGNGVITVNNHTLDEYFGGLWRHKKMATKPLELFPGAKGYDFNIDVMGGGVTGQADAIRHGIARAIVEIDPSLKLTLKKEGLMTRDPRMVERKKPGQPKARKRFQFSKR
jgi:small subunit ribosomal protein S9